MTIRKAVDNERRVHALPDGARARTLCRLSTVGLVIRDEDWELGSHRASCAHCVDLMALRHLGLTGPLRSCR
jgi:hypothetical protein